MAVIWQMTPQERMTCRTCRAEFDKKASRYRQNIHGRLDEVRAALASRWQQWSEREHEHEYKSATMTQVSNPRRNHTSGNLWWNKGNKGQPPRHATLALKKGDTTMTKMFKALGEHPLVVDSNGEHNIMLDDKVNDGSEHNVEFTTVLGFNLTVGYSRYKDSEFLGCAHAWVAFGEGCNLEWHRQLSVLTCC